MSTLQLHTIWTRSVRLISLKISSSRARQASLETSFVTILSQRPRVVCGPRLHNVRHYAATPIWATGARKIPHFLLQAKKPSAPLFANNRWSVWLSWRTYTVLRLKNLRSLRNAQLSPCTSYWWWTLSEQPSRCSRSTRKSLWCTKLRLAPKHFSSNSDNSLRTLNFSAYSWKITLRLHTTARDSRQRSRTGNPAACPKTQSAQAPPDNG